MLLLRYLVNPFSPLSQRTKITLFWNVFFKDDPEVRNRPLNVIKMKPNGVIDRLKRLYDDPENTLLIRNLVNPF